jgi:hypothetical protein
MHQSFNQLLAIDAMLIGRPFFPNVSIIFEILNYTDGQQRLDPCRQLTAIKYDRNFRRSGGTFAEIREDLWAIRISTDSCAA